MFSELGLTLYLNGLSPILLKLSYYVSQSVYLLIFASVVLAARRRGRASGAYNFFAILLIYLINFEFKQLFNVPRPDDDGLNFIEKEFDPRFPSGHAAVSFGAAALSGQRIFYLWAGLISVSRLVLGLHYLTDILAGAFFGWLLGRIAQEHKKTIFQVFFGKKNIFETRRQLFHAFFGSLIALFVYFAPKDFAVFALAASLIISVIVSFALRNRLRVPVISRIIGIFERKKDLESFPLKGSIFFQLGAFISVFLFGKDIAAASIIILALGDCFSTLVGKPFGRTKHPHNAEKSVEGSLAGFLVALIGIIPLLPFRIAVIGAAAGMIVESFNLKFFGIEIDDNLVIPVICGAVMTVAGF